jgi:lipopolysaccharide biosynthesis glycosyltransferase
MLGVMLHSLAKSAEPGSNYAVHLLCNENGLDKNRLGRLKKQIDGYENMTLATVNVDDTIVSHFSMGNCYVSAAYYRLLAPLLLPEIERIVYLDCDIIVRNDISPLYNTALSESELIAAALDTPMLGQAFSELSILGGYIRSLGIAKPEEYFNSGVMLMDLEKFRRSELVPQMLDYAQKHNCKFVDQDVLNFYCQKRTHLLSTVWNKQHCWQDNSFLRLAPIAAYEDYLGSVSDANILHFAGTKPWDDVGVQSSEMWWAAARETQWYEFFLQRLNERQRRPRTEAEIIADTFAITTSAVWLHDNLTRLRKWNEAHKYAALVDLALERKTAFDEIDQSNIKILKSAKNIIFYGGGNWCKTFLEFFDILDLSYPSEIWDINSAAMYPRINGVRVVAPDYEKLTSDDLLVITIESREISRQIEKNTGRAKVLIHDDIKAILGRYLIEKTKE